MKCKRCPSDAHTRGHCEPCYRYLLHTGRFTQYRKVDVTETFVHIHRLRELNWTYRQIWEHSGVIFGHISAIHRGEYAQVRGDTARKILSVPLVESASRHSVQPIGTQRRIQALLWMGWPAREIAERCDCKVSTINKISCDGGGRGRVSSRLAKLIANVYDDIAHISGPSKQCTTKAKSYGYVSPMAWDDDTIDDPDATPNLGEEEPSRSNVIVSEARFLASYGASREEIARRLGVTVATLRTYLGRAA